MGCFRLFGPYWDHTPLGKINFFYNVSIRTIASDSFLWLPEHPPNIASEISPVYKLEKPNHPPEFTQITKITTSSNCLYRFNKTCFKVSIAGSLHKGFVESPT